MCMLWESIRAGGALTAARLKAAETQNLSLKAVKSILFSFDPFRPGIKSMREFMHAAYGPEARKTNPSCRLKIDIRNDRSEPCVEAKLEDGRTLRIYTENLTLYHVAKMYNKYVPEHVPPIPWYTRYFEAKRIDNARKEARKWKPKWWKR